MGLEAALFAQTSVAAAGAYSRATAASGEASFQSQQLGANARLAEMQAQDALAQGDFEAHQRLQEGRRNAEDIASAFAGGNIDPSFGTAAHLAEEERAMSVLDALEARNNARKQAFGYEVQATNYRTNARMVRLAGRNERRMSLLAGGAEIAQAGVNYGYKAERAKKLEERGEVY